MPNARKAKDGMREVRFSILTSDYDYLVDLLSTLEMSRRDYFMGLHLAAIENPVFAHEAARRWQEFENIDEI